MVLVRVSSILQVWRGEIFWERLWDYLMLLWCGTFSWQKSRELRLNQNWTKLKDYGGCRGILLWLVRCWLHSETNETQILAPDNTKQVSGVCELHETLAIWGGKWCNISEFSAWREKWIQGIRSERTAGRKHIRNIFQWISRWWNLIKYEVGEGTLEKEKQSEI